MTDRELQLRSISELTEGIHTFSFPTATDQAAATAELQRIRANLPDILRATRNALSSQDELKPLKFWSASKVAKLDYTDVGSFSDWCFIGDLHGDFFSFFVILSEIEKTHIDPKIVLLGDLVDRGVHSIETFALALDWGLKHRGRLIWIAGNHDIGFAYSTDKGQFEPQVKPAEFVEYLNSPSPTLGYRREIGLAFQEIAAGLPRAVLFPDGLLATHGGFPLSDQYSIASSTRTETEFLEWLASPQCLADFTWARIHRARKKIPDRHSTGSQYGFEDFQNFCSLRPEWFGVSRMINGHTHPHAGYDKQINYVQNPVLTLVGFGYSESNPSDASQYRSEIYFAEAMQNSLPIVKAIEINREELERFFIASGHDNQVCSQVTQEAGSEETLAVSNVIQSEDQHPSQRDEQGISQAGKESGSLRRVQGSGDKLLPRLIPITLIIAAISLAVLMLFDTQSNIQTITQRMDGISIKSENLNEIIRHMQVEITRIQSLNSVAFEREQKMAIQLERLTTLIQGQVNPNIDAQNPIGEKDKNQESRSEINEFPEQDGEMLE